MVPLGPRMARLGPRNWGDWDRDWGDWGLFQKATGLYTRATRPTGGNSLAGATGPPGRRLAGGWATTRSGESPGPGPTRRSEWELATTVSPATSCVCGPFLGVLGTKSETGLIGSRPNFSHTSAIFPTTHAPIASSLSAMAAAMNHMHAATVA